MNINSAGELIAAIPHMIGQSPENAIVMMGFKGSKMAGGVAVPYQNSAALVRAGNLFLQRQVDGVLAVVVADGPDIAETAVNSVQETATMNLIPPLVGCWVTSGLAPGHSYTQITPRPGMSGNSTGRHRGYLPTVSNVPTFKTNRITPDQPLG